MEARLAIIVFARTRSILNCLGNQRTDCAGIALAVKMGLRQMRQCITPSGVCLHNDVAATLCHMPDGPTDMAAQVGPHRMIPHADSRVYDIVQIEGGLAY